MLPQKNRKFVLSRGISSLLFIGVAGAIQTTRSATRTWDAGGDGVTIGTAANWSEDTLPSVAAGDTALWDGTVAGPLSLSYLSAAYAGVAGNPGINLSLASGQTSSLSIDSGTNASALRLNGISIAAGAGAFTLGNGIGTFNVTLGGTAGETHTWTNNSSNRAIIGTDVAFTGVTGAHTLVLDGSGDWAMRNVISNGGGTLSLTKNGSGTLILRGVNTYTGANTINGGTVAFTLDSNLGATAAAVNLNGATLQANLGASISNTHLMTVTGASTLYINNPSIAAFTYAFNTASTLAGNGALTVTGNGSLGVSGLNTGVMVLNVANAASAFTGTLTMQSGGLLEIGNSTAFPSALPIALNGNGGLTVNTGVTLASNVTVTNAGNVLNFGNGNAGVVTGNITLNNDLTVGLRDWYNWATGRSGAINGVISGSGGLNVIAPGSGANGTLTLGAANTYQGATTLFNAGLTLAANATSSIATSSGLSLSDSTLTASYTAGITDKLKDTGAVSLRNNSFLNLTGNASDTTETIGTLTFAGGNSTINVVTTGTAVTTLAAASLARTNLGTGLIIGSSLGQQAASVGKISLVTAPSGGDFVGAGGAPAGTGTTKNLAIVPWLRGASVAANTASTDFVTYDPTLGSLRPLVAGEYDATIAAATAGNNVKSATTSETGLGGATLNSLFLAPTAAQTITGTAGTTLTISSGALASGVAAGLFGSTAFNSTISGFDAVAFGNGEAVVSVAQTGGTITINSPLSVSGGGGLTKTGRGTLVLGAANTYTGQTTVNQGILSATAVNNLFNGATGTAVVLSNAATLNVNATTQAITSLTMNGAGGTLSGANGTVNLGGDITFDTSATNPNAATTISVTNLNLNGNRSVNVGDAPTVTGADMTISSAIADGSAASSLTKTGAGILALTGTSTYTGGTTISAGTLQVGTGGTAGSIVGNVVNNGILTFNRSDAVNFAGSLSGAGDLMHLGAGTTTLSGGGLSSGKVIIRAGTLNVSTLSGSGAIEIGSAATAVGLIYSGAGETTSRVLTLTGTTGGVTLTQNGTGLLRFTSDLLAPVNGAKTITLTGTGNGEFAGRIVDSGNGATGITKAGAGTWTLSGPNGVTGAILVSGGTLNLSGTLAANNLGVGTVANVTGAVYQTGGAVGLGQAANVANFSIGSVVAGYGYYNLSGGSVTTNEAAIAGSFDGAAGVMDILGGTLTSNGNLFVGRGGNTNATITAGGILNVLGGSVNYSGKLDVEYANAPTGAQVNALTIGGGAGVATVTGPSTATASTNRDTGGALIIMGGATGGGTAVVNLLTNGTATVPQVASFGATGTAHLNFNGGTLKATATNTGAAFMGTNATALDAVNVFGNGGTIDNSGTSITISQALLAPAGSGITSGTVAVPNGGSGYIGAPLVNITGGTGTGATGYATLANGVVTGIVITSPGTGYTAGDQLTAAFTGGLGTGGVAATSVTSIGVGANTSGGITFTGSGTTTLTSTGSSYGGPTRISGGTLSIGMIFNGGQPAATLGSSSNAASNLIFDGGALRYTGPTASTDRSFTITTGKTATFDVTTAGSVLTLTGGAAATNGGLTKIGNGALAITGAANLYTGATTITGGVLDATGTFNSPFTTNGGRLNAGLLAVGMLTVPSLTLGNTGGVDFELVAPGNNDVITIGNAGGLTLGVGTQLNLFDTGGLPFTVNGLYTLFDYNTSFTGNLSGAFTIANGQPGKFYSFTNDTSATSLQLTISDAAISEWNVAGGGSWNSAANWTAGIPNGVGAQTTFGAAITAPAVVTMSGPKTVGVVTFDNLNSYTVTGGATDLLTLDNAGGVEQITVVSGTHTVSAPIVLAGPSTFSAAANGRLVLSGNITGGQPVTISDLGTVALSGNNALSGVVTINAGTLEVGGSAAVAGATSIVEKNAATLLLTGVGTTLAQPITFDLAGANPAGATGAENGNGNFTLATSPGSSATLSSVLNVASGSLVVRGGGALTLTGNGANVLGNSGGLATVIQNGSLTLDGGAGATYGVTGQLTIGDNTPNQATLTLASGTLNVSSFTNIGRGNGTTGLASTLHVTGGVLNTLNLFTGFANGVTGYNAVPTVNISGAALVNVTNTAANAGVALGESAGSLSPLNISGTATLTSAGDFRVGVAGRAILRISDGATVSTALLSVGRGDGGVGNTGAGVVRQTGGTFQQAGTLGGDWRIGGGVDADDVGTYGSYTISAGALNAGARNFQLGAFGVGILDVAGGAVTVGAGVPVIGRFASGVGSVNLTAGSITKSGTGQLFIIGEEGRGVVNVGGTGSLTVESAAGTAGTAGGTGGIRLGGAATGNGTLNLLPGGTVTASGITETVAAATSNLYLNGGTLIANAANATFMQGLDRAVVGPNGATINTNGNNISIAQPLLAATGSGVVTIPVTDGGTGYLGRPIVQITGGGGTGATALANVNAAGVVTSITVTNPGVDYTSAPTVTLLGGSPTTAAAVGTVATAANGASGGLTKTGTGTLNLNGVSTFMGPTLVTAGGLGGTGTLSGAVTMQTGTTLAPGSGGVGTLTVAGLTLATGTNLIYEFGVVNDKVVVTGNNGLTINGGTFTLNDAGAATFFSTVGAYSVFDFVGTIGGTGPSALSVAPASQVAGKTYNFGVSGSSVILTIGTAGVTTNVWNVDASGDWTTGTNWTAGTPPNAPQAAAAFGEGGATITAPRTVNLNANQTVGTISFKSAQPFTISGANTLTLDNGASAQITVTEGSHVIGVPINTVSSALQLTALSGSTLTLSGPLSGSTNVTKNGTGVITLSGANTYTGTNTLSDGTLMLTGAGTLGNAGNAVTINGGTLDLGSTSQTTGAVTMNAGTISNGTLTPTSVTTTGTADKTISASISGATSVAKNGTAVLTLSGNNSYTGGTTMAAGTLKLFGNNTTTGTTTVNGGTLVINSDTSLGGPAAPLTFTAGVLQVDGTTATSLGSRVLTGFPTAVAISEAGETFSITQAIAAAGTFIKQGLGALRLTASNTFSSTASSSVQGGRLILDGGSLTAANVTSNIGIEVAPSVGSSATVDILPGTTLTTNRFIVGGNTANNDGGAAVVNQSGGTVNSRQWLAIGSSGNGSSQYNLSGGVLNVNAATGTNLELATFGAASGILNIGGNSQINLFNSASINMGAAANGSGSGTVNQTGGTVTFYSDAGVTAGGTGALRLGSSTGRTSTYTYNLQGGQLIVPTISRNTGTSIFNFNGGTLKPTGTSADFISSTIQTRVQAGGAIIDTAAGVTATISGNLAHDVALDTPVPTADGGLKKQGAGVLILSGSSDYTGPTVVEAGTLTVSGSINGSSSVAVNSGATLSGNGTILSNVALASGAKLSPGTDVATLVFGGDVNLSLAVAPDASAALLFDLGTPGDQALLTSGTLTIGTGTLAFDDFSFTAQNGFGLGTYTLFDSTVPLNGTLAAASSGAIGAFLGMLSTGDGTDIILTVMIPEPGSAAILASGMFAFLGMRRRCRR